MRCEYLFLVGDIIDLWAMKRKWYWPQSHNDVIRKILKRASKGTRVTYIPGNHDENFRGYLGLQFGGVEIKREAFHITADGKRVLMLHGDEFDTVVTNHHIITWFGDGCYDLLLAGGRVYNWLRRKFNWPHFSLAAYVKKKVKYIVNFVSNYQQSLLHYARSRRAEVVITGHPPPRDQAHRGDPLRQLRRLGGERAPPWSSTPTAAWRSSYVGHDDSADSKPSIARKICGDDGMIGSPRYPGIVALGLPLRAP
jgi:UDP-2,3-diacylglucosamine pyrophosphatase LpxH